MHSQNCNVLFSLKSMGFDFHCGLILHQSRSLECFFQHLHKQFCKMLFWFGRRLNDPDEPSWLTIFPCPTGLQLVEVLWYFASMSSIDLPLV